MQILAGVVEERGIERMLHGNAVACGIASFIVRTGNTYLGACMAVAQRSPRCTASMCCTAHVCVAISSVYLQLGRSHPLRPFLRHWQLPCGAGSLLWVDFLRLVGLQKKAETAKK